MTVTQEEKNAMASFMSVMNEGNDEMLPAVPSVMESVGEVDHSLGEIDKEQSRQAMASILEGFNNAMGDDGFKESVVESFRNASETVAEEATYNHPLRAALNTTKTDTGFIYGEYELLERKQTEKRSFFSIRHTGTGETLVKDLYLKESGISLVNMLNEGLPINNRRCMEALNNDQRYASALVDMAQAKKGMKKGNRISEDRYDQARDKAVRAKTVVKKLMESF